jgi:hypothetical protein
MGFCLTGVVSAVLLLFLGPFVQGLSVASAYEAMEVKEGGKIAGVVKVAGEVGERKPLRVFKYKEVCGEQVADESLVVGPEKGLRYAVVTLEGIARGKAVEREVVNMLDNQACRFVPHVQAASTGQWLELRNSDPILHNADARLDTKRTLFNVALPPGRETRKPLAYPGIIQVTCDVRHTWMDAYIVVSEHPYYAVTDLYGEYELREVPPGTYKLRVWHEVLGMQEKEVRVEAGKEVEVNFALPIKEGGGG